MKNSERRRRQTVRSRTKGEKIAIMATLAIGFFSLAGLFLPNDYRVIRVKYIKAKPAAVSPYINDLHMWKTWFPWKKLGNPHHFKFGKTASGEGATMSWIGEDGEGLVTFTKSSPEKGINYKLSLNDGSYQSDAALHHTEFKKGKTYVSWKSGELLKNP